MPFSTNNSFSKKAKKQVSEFPKVHKILLTGGPCAGKTTLLAKLQSILDNKGYRVYSVPEAATMMMTAGTNLDSSKESSDYQIALQTSMLKMQMNLEDVFVELAENESYSSLV